MKRVVYPLAFIVLGLTLLIQGCEFLYEYDITVINDTNFDFSVYLDDELQFKLAPGGESTIRNVEGGDHLLEARVRGDVVAERFVDLDADLKWTVYVDTYEITVINDTDSSFSVYLDGVFQFELRPGYSVTIEDVSEGIHTLDARVGSQVIADRTIDVHQNIEWTVY